MTTLTSEVIRIGLPRMRKEPGERRAFLPSLVGRLARRGAEVALEEGYGAEMGVAPEEYLAPGVRFVDHAEAYAQDYVLVLRCPADEEIRRMRPGACLLSMLHFPTRPQRVSLLRALGLEAVSLDSLKDDSGRRLVENLRAVAWNGVEAAFGVLRRTYPRGAFEDPARGPLRVTLLGAGAVGSHVVQAATRYGNETLRQRLAADGVPGVQVQVVDYDVTRHEAVMRGLLANTDLLVDATQRPDPSVPAIPNAWLASMPGHAVLLDLSVDPYDCGFDPPYIKGLEGIPQGNLDQYVFAPDDPAWDHLPSCVDRRQRRWAVSCYSWPGVYPRRCMHLYGQQLQPILRTIIEKGGLARLNPDGTFFERAIARALLSRWGETKGASV
jgi:alanine dehydrogenase